MVRKRGKRENYYVCVCEYKIVSILGKSMSVKERVCVCVVFCVCGCGVCMGEGDEREMSQ